MDPKTGLPSDCQAAGDLVAAAPLTRLTNREYENTLDDLFPAAALPVPTLPTETKDDGFDNGYCHYHGRQGWHCHDGGFDDFDDDDFGVGFGFEFGVLVGIPVGIVNILVGGTSPFHIVFFEDHDGADFFLPITGMGGAEIRLGERLNVFGLIQPGVTFQWNEHFDDTEPFFRFWAGIEYALAAGIVGADDQQAVFIENRQAGVVESQERGAVGFFHRCCGG